MKSLSTISLINLVSNDEKLVVFWNYNYWSERKRLELIKRLSENFSNSFFEVEVTQCSTFKLISFNEIQL